MSTRDKVVELLVTHRNAQIVRIVGCSPQYVSQIRKKEGVPPPQRTVSLTAKDRSLLNKIRRLLDSGHRPMEILPHTPFKDSGGLRGWCKVRGLNYPAFPRGAQRVIDDNKLKKHIAAGGDYRTFAKQNGCSWITAHRAGKRLGLRPLSLRSPIADKLTEKMERKILAEFEATGSIRQVITRLELPAGWVRFVLIKHKVKYVSQGKEAVAARVAKCLLLWGKSKDLEKIARKLNLSRETIKRYLSKCGIDYRKRRRS